MRSTMISTLAAVALLAVGSTNSAAQARAAHHRCAAGSVCDRVEDRRDRREDRRDAREDVRDARHEGGVRDRIEDRRDAREDVRDRREDRRERRRDGGARGSRAA